ncbi:epsin-2-like [Tropilaelaps mercedesae]|uniref:Epsin-2-like n=1 Tax=Tropilaelaps mercedesae TaxID=418985 RepID=A0A1V9XZF9_9ACAR|nr:epsin-2-like [Tropilaelaps mercedesae]
MMNVNVQGIRRNVMNVVRNYTDAQVKVRKATSNDRWGPPSALMGEIADLSYNVVAFTEIMQIIWKRLNDSGKNWRHVYKALVLLEYLIKVGSERVATQCKENIFAIQTLKDFQYMEDNKDQGMNVREKSKQLVTLLKDDERLRQERARALKAKERFAQNTNTASSSHDTSGGGGGSYGDDLSSPRGDYRSVLASSSELESARPQTAGEEELQLQLALAMSKEEAEQEERQRKNDDLRLQMALTESQQDTVKQGGATASSGGAFSASNGSASSSSAPKSCMDDLLGLNLAGSTVAPAQPADPWGLPTAQTGAAAVSGHISGSQVVDAMSVPLVGVVGGATGAGAMPAARGAVGGVDPWTPAPAVAVDPWAPQPASSLPSAAPVLDPWTVNGSAAGVSKGELDEFDLISRQRAANMSPSITGQLGGTSSASHSPAFDMSGLGGALPKNSTSTGQDSRMRKTPESFLGPNSNLVNLDALVTAKPVAPPANPFGSGTPGANSLLNPSPAPQQNPFQALNKAPTMNELRGGPAMAAFDGFAAPTRTTPTPGAVNPFL